MRVPRSEMIRTALRPASAVWAVVSRSRNLMYDRGIASIRKLPVPVVSVGNITVGGTGKSPTTIDLARRLIASGLRPLVLSRGYASKGYGTRVVSDGVRVLLGPDEAGDEPVMIAMSVPGLPVVVDPDRLRGGYAAVRRFSPDLVILDDGYQHRRLGRDLDIVLLDAVDPFGRYALLPTGFLREPFSGLARADVFLVTHAPAGETLGTLTAVLRRYNTRAPIFRASHRADSLLPVSRFAVPVTTPSSFPVDGTAKAGSGADEKTNRAIGGLRLMTDTVTEGSMSADLLEDAPVFAFCGVGNPEGFRATLLEAGAHIVGFASYRDHHRFSGRELEDLQAAASRASAKLVVTTEKDAVRIAGAVSNDPRASGAIPLSSFLALRIRMEIPEGDTLLESMRALVRTR